MKKRYSEVAWIVGAKKDKDELPVIRTYEENGYIIKVYPPCFGPDVSTTARKNATSRTGFTTPAI